MIHTPILLKECVDFLTTEVDGTYFDATAGFGGHSTEILYRISSKGRLIATDKDQSAFDYCKQKFVDDKRYCIYNTSFKNIDTISKIEFIGPKFDPLWIKLKLRKITKKLKIKIKKVLRMAIKLNINYFKSNN